MPYVKIITGVINSGKTTLAAILERKYRTEGKSIAGFFAEARIEDGRKTGYYLRNISGDEKMLAVSEKPETGDMIRYNFSKFYFSAECFQRAGEILKAADADVIIIDEIGPLELNGKGFCDIVKYLLQYYPGIMILVIREALLDRTIEYFGIDRKNAEVLKPELIEK